MADRFSRKNRGSKMQSLYDDRDLDDFYNKMYGGFEEKNNDNEFIAPPSVESKESRDDDSVSSTDSDFSDTEVESDVEMVSESVVRKRNVYKDPRKKIKNDSKIPNNCEPVHLKSKQIKFQPVFENKSFRSSTNERREQVEMEVKIRQEISKMRTKPKRKKYKIFTQHEMLKEAKITESINLESLEYYKKLEIERKRKNKKALYVLKDPKVMHLWKLQDKLKDETNSTQTEVNYSTSHTISFTDEYTKNVYLKTYIYKRNNCPKHKICQVTGRMAKYIDPLTKMPYATLEAFALIRKTYATQSSQKNVIPKILNPAVSIPQKPIPKQAIISNAQNVNIQKTIKPIVKP